MIPDDNTPPDPPVPSGVAIDLVLDFEQPASPALAGLTPDPTLHRAYVQRLPDTSNGYRPNEIHIEPVRPEERDHVHAPWSRPLATPEYVTEFTGVDAGHTALPVDAVAAIFTPAAPQDAFLPVGGPPLEPHPMLDHELVNVQASLVERRPHIFTVEVHGCTAEQADQVMAERLSCDEDYGFSYVVDYAKVNAQQLSHPGRKAAADAQDWYVISKALRKELDQAKEDVEKFKKLAGRTDSILQLENEIQRLRSVNEELTQQLTAELGVTKALRLELADWRALRDVSHNVVPGDDGMGEERDPTPASVRDHLNYLQAEWDGAEKRAGEAERVLAPHRDKNALQVELIALLKNDIRIRDEFIASVKEADDTCGEKLRHISSDALKAAAGAAGLSLEGWKWYHWLSPRAILRRGVAVGWHSAARFLKENFES